MFDKLAADSDIGGQAVAEGMPTVSREEFRNFAIPNLERFTEASLRATIRRDLAWLLSTLSLESSMNLDHRPHVRASVLNYGVRDFAGRAQSRRAVLAQAREIREAILRFEPRLDPSSLRVEPTADLDDPGKIGFTIEAEIRGAANQLPVRFRTTIDTDTAAVEVAE
ncbi:MAG TPA: type VI secretion system baseplate subunit TssE [Sphingopyxis sp.]|nr:type VI secretion system baseplate subunit TssE [Sphingopyxis sp.]HMQ18306.1 type VI secretion system baseplate subunit TssE [Sphingopyxis sp.]